MNAHYVADGALNNAVEWLERQVGVMDQAFLNTNYNGTYDSTPIAVDNKWSWTANISPNTSGSGLYDIVATAYWRGNASREIRATVQQDTFAKYALFIDRWPSGNGDPRNDLIFTLGDSGIQGPFHTNDFFNLKAPTGAYFTSPGIPWASGPRARLTHVREMPAGQSTLASGIGDGNRYYGGNYMGNSDTFTPFDNSDGTPNSGSYARMVDGGRERISRVDHINLPPDLTNLRSLSWRDDEDQTGQNSAALGINVNTDLGPNAHGGTVSGGVYIDGNAEKLHLELTQNDNQQITVRGRSEYWRRWVPNIVMVDDWDCVPNGTYTQGSEILEPYTCDLWGIVDWILPNGSNGLSSPEPVYGWIPNANTCYRSYTPPRYNPPTQNCTNTLICTACVPQDQGGYEYAYTDPGPGWQLLTQTDSHDSYVIEVTSGTEANSDPTDSANAIGSIGYTINANTSNPVYIDGTQVTTDTNVQVGQVIVKQWDDTLNDYNHRILNGDTNGVVFVDGHINSLQGINRGARYTDDRGVDDWHGRLIVANPGSGSSTSNGRDIQITEDILQYYPGSSGDSDPLSSDTHPNTLTRGETSPNDQHILGIIGEDVWLNTPNRPGTHFSPTGSSGDGSLDVYAVIMAGRTRVNNSTGQPLLDGNGRPQVLGGFGTHSNDTQNGDGEGLFRLFGGIIGANGRKTYETYGTGSPQGYGMELNYDEIAALNLENFPTYNSYSLVRYTERHVGLR